MSRYIDPDEPLSPQDRAYLAERNKHRQIFLHDERVGGSSGLTPTTPAPPEGSPSGSGSVVVEPPKDPEPADETGVSAEEREWVETMTVDELREELEKENQPTTGKKAELQERLLSVLAAQD